MGLDIFELDILGLDILGLDILGTPPRNQHTPHLLSIRLTVDSRPRGGRTCLTLAH